MGCSRRLLAAGCLGYVLLFWSELVLGGTTGFVTSADPVMLWLLYAVLAYALLSVAAVSGAAGWAGLLLVGLVYGWLREGVVSAGMYGGPEALPGSLAAVAWPAAGWHAAVSVGLGWGGVSLALGARGWWPVLLACLGLGVAWGLVSAANGEPVGPWAARAALDAGLLIAAYAGLRRVGFAGFRPTREECWAMGLVAGAYFVLVTVPADPRAAAVGPVCFGGAAWLLRRLARSAGQRGSPGAAPLMASLDRRARLGRLAALALLPVVAVTTRGLILPAEPGDVEPWLRAVGTAAGGVALVAAAVGGLGVGRGLARAWAARAAGASPAQSPDTLPQPA